MQKLVLVVAALTWLLLPGDDGQRSPVRMLRVDDGLCSAVVLGPHLAVTAAHCGVGTPVAADVAVLRGTFAPPYARLGAAPKADDNVLLEGFGCDTSVVWLWRQHHRGVRAAQVLVVGLPRPGLELGLFGRVCHGDSGGAVWADGGGLVGLITATAVDGAPLAYATPLPPHLR